MDAQFIEIRTVGSRKQLLMTLWLLASPDSFRSVADRFGVSKSVLWHCFKNTCEGIARLSQRVIRWPSPEEMRRSEREFYRIASFPGVIGCVDGTHIEISAPCTNPMDYNNRKDFCSLILQGTVNRKLQFIDCYVGEAGRNHDARVFARSEIGQHLTDLIPENFHLLGDSAYPLHLNLLTPFRDNGTLTDQQIRYNRRLSMTRSTVERAFGQLKGRFRRLKYLEEKNIHIVPSIVMACCVLHNILRTGQAFEDEDEDEHECSNSSDDDDDDDDDNDVRPDSTAAQKRYSIMNSL